MNIQKIYLKLFAAAFLYVLTIQSFSFSQDKNINYSVSTNNIYFPGDEINLNLYSYNYDNIF